MLWTWRVRSDEERSAVGYSAIRAGLVELACMSVPHAHVRATGSGRWSAVERTKAELERITAAEPSLSLAIIGVMVLTEVIRQSEGA